MVGGKWFDKFTDYLCLVLYVVSPIVFVVAIIAMGVALVFVAMHEATTETVTLDLAEWACSASHKEEVRRLSGKIMVTSIDVVCTQWQRKGAQ